MLHVSQAFLSQLFGKKQMLPRAVGAGRRHIKALTYVLKGCLSLSRALSSTLTQVPRGLNTLQESEQYYIQALTNPKS